MQQDVQMSNSILIVKKHRRADFDIAGGEHIWEPLLSTPMVYKSERTQKKFWREENRSHMNRMK